jgi:O-methyltransferase domain/Dimerisation domain
MEALPNDATLRQSDAAGAQQHDRMLQMITGFWVTQIVHAVAKYRIADELAQGPATAAEIASRRSIHPEATARLLRACASLGLVTWEAPSRFTGTALLDTLRRDTPGSLWGAAISQAAPGHWLPWGNFVEAISTGERQTVATLGGELWQHYAKMPAEAEAFTASMSGLTAMIAEDAATVIDIGSSRIAVDVGGAAGALVHALMLGNPTLRGIVLDLPNVVPDAVAAAARLGLEQRFSGICGDFFVSVPEADLYLLKFILHDWNDASCVQILENCRRGMLAGGQIAVIELQIGPMNEPGLAPLMDLNMLVMLTGRERTLSEYRALFAAAGLNLAKVTRLRSGMTVMIATSESSSDSVVGTADG